MEAENHAVSYLEACGFSVLARNYRGYRGEIDIVALDGNTLCFIEVKARGASFFGLGCEAVDIRKQERIRRTAEQYLNEHHIAPFAAKCRFDVVSIDAGVVSLYKDAF